MTTSLAEIKTQIIAALEHPEADEGLYFLNFLQLHEEDERPAVEASAEDLLEALKELLRDGSVVVREEGEELIFSLAQPNISI